MNPNVHTEKRRNYDEIYNKKPNNSEYERYNKGYKGYEEQQNNGKYFQRRGGSLKAIPVKYKKLMIQGFLTALLATIIIYFLSPDETNEAWKQKLKLVATTFIVVLVCYVIVGSLFSSTFL